MALRKAGAYSKRYARPYTRKSSKKSQNFIRSVPPQKIVKFKMGEIKGYEGGKFNIILRMISTEHVQIRDNALEATRQYIHKQLEEQIPGQYYFEVRVFPHHVLRENKMLTGAGADRMQKGMAHSFGGTMGRAAFVKAKGEIFLVGVSSEKGRKAVYGVFQRVKSKLPCGIRVHTEIKKVV